MPETDLPRDQLRELLPEAREPADFDTFWRESVEEVRSFPLDAEFTPVDSLLAELSVFDVGFRGYGGERIRGWLVLPRNGSGPLACVVSFVGYGGGRGRPLSWTVAPSAGFAQFVMDTRGQGSHFQAGATADGYGSSPHAAGFTTLGIDAPGAYYYRRVFLDAVRAIDAAIEHPRVDAHRLIAHGESQGGAIALAATALSGRGSAVVSEVPFLSDIPRAVRLAGEGPYLELVRYFATHGDEAALRTLAYFDASCFSRRISVPGQFAVALRDTVCPPSSVFAAYNVFAGPKELLVYPYNGHEHGRDAQTEARLAFASRVVGDEATA